MDGDEVERPRLSKRFSDTLKPGEVDFKTKAGTAWSHSYLNQKPWHPLSYPNQRRKWIAEQTQAQHQRRAEEVSREYAQEQEFFRQTALITNKEKEKVEMMKAVSFMYVRPPGYDVESAKAAEVAEEMRRQGQGSTSQEQSVEGTSAAKQLSEQVPPPTASAAEVKKKPRPKDVFGRALPTEEEFEVLKNAPRLETGVPARSKPFGVEVRNVRCLRCGNFGHQSGDRECPLKDAIMPNEENRLKRDDPLTAITAHTEPSEPLKWELKQKPGMSPPRGGFDPDDPNQQIVAEDIFDEYGGFLSGGDIPELLSNFSSKSKKRKSSKRTKRRWQSSPTDNLRTAQGGSSNSTDEEMRSEREKRHKKKKQKEPNLSKSDDSESYMHNRTSRIQHFSSSDDSEPGRWLENRNHREKHLHSTYEVMRSEREKRHKKKQKELNLSKSDDSESYRHYRTSRIQHSSSSDDSEPGRWMENRNHRKKHLHPSEELDSGDQKNDRRKGKGNVHSYSSEDSECMGKNSDRITTKEDIKTRSTEVSDFSKQDKSKYLQRSTNSVLLKDSESEVHYLNSRSSRKSRRPRTSDNSDYESQHRSRKSGRRDVHSPSLEDSDSERQVKEWSGGRNFNATKEKVAGHHHHHHHHHQSSRHRPSCLSDDSNSDGHCRKGSSRRKHPSDTDRSRMHRHHRNIEAREKRSPSEDGHYRSWKSGPKCSEDRSYEDPRRRRDTKRSQHERH